MEARQTLGLVRSLVSGAEETVSIHLADDVLTLGVETHHAAAFMSLSRFGARQLIALLATAVSYEEGLPLDDE